MLSARNGRLRAHTSPPGLGWAAIIVAAALAISPIASGYFDFTVWGPLALGAMALLVIVAWVSRPSMTRAGRLACAALLTLLALSAASLLWSESKESTWTAVNRLGLYAVLFIIVVLAVRERRTGRVVVLILGSAALVTSLWLCISLLLGGSQGAFLERRLNSPIGYINGTAGLLVMGIWPWVALSETAGRRSVRAAAMAASSLIAGTFVLTESRAVIPAMVASAAVVLLAAPERTRRAMNLLLVAASVAASLPWTLAVYSSGGEAQRTLDPSHGVLRAAALALVLSAVGAGVLRCGLSLLAERLDPARLRLAVRRLGQGLTAAAVAALVAGLAFGSPWLSREYRSFTAMKANGDTSVRFIDASGFRYDLWRVAAKEFRSHPLGGLGAGNYDTEYYALRQNPEYLVQPHSLELQMAAELGVGGILALLLFCGAILWSGFARHGTLASQDRLIKVAALGMFTAWLTHTSVDWLYDIPGLAGMGVVAGALLVAAVGHQGVQLRSRRAQALLVVSFSGLALLAASVGRQYVATRYAQSGADQVSKSPRSAIPKLQQAAQLDPYSVTTLYSLAAAYARLDDYPSARGALELASEREPHNYVPPALLGDLAVRRGDYRVAAAEYRAALSLNPRDGDLAHAERTARRGAS